MHCALPQRVEVRLKGRNHGGLRQAEVAVVAGDLAGREIQIVHVAHVLRERDVLRHDAFREELEAQRNLNRRLVRRSDAGAD